MNQLPVLAHANAIKDAVGEHRRLILVAPPGTGKSTQVPQILWPENGLTIVLQPRRVAARTLAARIAAERNEALGDQVGYQVRFEKARSKTTRVLFETYGVFWQHILQEPRLPGISLVILDEFHERTLESDACLAWLRTLQSQRADLSIVVMSATLDDAALNHYLAPCTTLHIEAPAYPVTIEHFPPNTHEQPWDQAARAFRHLVATGLNQSALIFMPGVGEIKRTADALHPFCRERGWTVLELSGTQSLTDQQNVLKLPEQQPCVIVATNIAETSLTIPGVTAVIDSGRSRQAAYDADRDLNTLHLGWIAKANATQRAGRAGRLAPGRCLRLWPKGHETSLSDTLPPEIARLDLAGLALAVAALPQPVSFLTPPPKERWERAIKHLHSLGALDNQGITTSGREILRYPLPPALARVLLADPGHAGLIAAMIAIVESADRKDFTDEGDLYLLGLDMARETQRRRWHRDVTETYKQLLRLTKTREAPPAALPEVDERERRRAVTMAWLSAYRDRLAFREARAYHLADGRKGTPSAGNPQSPLLIAIELHEVSGGSGRQATIPLYLPCEPGWVGEGEPEIVCGWDETRQRVVQERVYKLGEQILRREALPPDQWDRRAAEALLAQKLIAGEAKLAAWDEDIEQLVHRITLTARAYPELGVSLTADDWEVLFHELASDKTGASDISKDLILETLRDYVGWAAMSTVDREAPRTYKLPGGRQGRITYYEDAPPELSARLGDMLGLEGTLTLLGGRVQVLFDILAPNYRTVQKTYDMSSFWKNTYPEVKKELKRRYPKHPWP